MIAFMRGLIDKGVIGKCTHHECSLLAGVQHFANYDPNDHTIEDEKLKAQYEEETWEEQDNDDGEGRNGEEQAAYLYFQSPDNVFSKMFATSVGRALMDRASTSVVQQESDKRFVTKLDPLDVKSKACAPLDPLNTDLDSLKAKIIDLISMMKELRRRRMRMRRRRRRRKEGGGQ